MTELEQKVLRLAEKKVEKLYGKKVVFQSEPARYEEPFENNVCERIYEIGYVTYLQTENGAWYKKDIFISKYNGRVVAGVVRCKKTPKQYA